MTSSSSIKLHNEEPQEEEEQVAEFTEERSYIFEGRVERATELWESGKQKFRENLLDQALHDFKLALYHAEFDELSYNFELMDKHREQIDAIRVPLWLNAANCLCLITTNTEEERNSSANKLAYQQAVSFCDLAMKFDTKNAKALFRRARARELLEEWDLAIADLERAIGMDPMHAAEFQKALRRVKASRAEERQKLDAMWKNKPLFPLAPKEGAVVVETASEEKMSWLAWVWGLLVWFFSLAWLKREPATAAAGAAKEVENKKRF